MQHGKLKNWRDLKRAEKLASEKPPESPLKITELKKHIIWKGRGEKSGVKFGCFISRENIAGMTEYRIIAGDAVENFVPSSAEIMVKGGIGGTHGILNLKSNGEVSFDVPSKQRRGKIGTGLLTAAEEFGKTVGIKTLVANISPKNAAAEGLLKSLKWEKKKSTQFKITYAKNIM